MLATTIETHGGRELRVARSGSGRPVILLHGYPDNLQVWSELAPRLAERCEVIAFDWPGWDTAKHGAAERRLLILRGGCER